MVNKSKRINKQKIKLKTIKKKTTINLPTSSWLDHYIGIVMSTVGFSEV